MSYNSSEKKFVEKIAICLQDRVGLKPWFDDWELIAGEPTIENLGLGMKFSKSCAVFFGKSGEGPCHKSEMAVALNRHSENSEFRVIPVLLPGAKEPNTLPEFIKINTWVKFKDACDEDALWRLECGIKKIKPGNGRKKTSESRPGPKKMPVPHVDVSRLDQPGGAMDVESRFYIKRRADEEVMADIKRARGLATIRAPRQTGKSSLLFRIYANARRISDLLRPVIVDFQSFSTADFGSLNTVWRAIAVVIASQLQLNDWDPETWDAKRGYDQNISRFLDDHVFLKNENPMLLCLDETDRVFSEPIKTDFFASVRAFYNRGAFDPAWKKVRWLLCASTEPSFFIEDINQSPFNIGLNVKLNPFIREETREFAARHGLTLDERMTDRVMEYSGGRPYLLHLLFYHMVLCPESWEELFDLEKAGNGFFSDHLNHYLRGFQKDSKLSSAMKRVISGKGCEDIKLADRLNATGLVKWDSDGKVACVCRLYKDFFAGKL